MSKGEITILCSGFGLGLYVPGLLLENSLEQYGIPAKVHVFEDLIDDEKKVQVLKSKKAYHKNHSVALMSTRIPMDMRKSIDIHLVDQLIGLWEREERQNFIVLSGHWLHVLEEFKERNSSRKINIHILYVDGELSPSWKSIKSMKANYNQGMQEICLYDREKLSIQFQIPITDKPPVPYTKRNGRFLIHGGGWGVGNYQEKIPELEDEGIPLDIVVYDIFEAKANRNKNRYFMIDSTWEAWEKNKNDRYEFPPLTQIIEGTESYFEGDDRYHSLFEITREANAIIGKPGAGTLMDSLGAATPLIILEPFCDHELKNAQVWESAGFGIRYEKWKESGYSTDMLKTLHDNLIEKRAQIADISLYFAQKVMEMSEAEH